MDVKDKNALLRQLPKVDEVLKTFAAEMEEIPQVVIKTVVQGEIDRCRQEILKGERNELPEAELYTRIKTGILERKEYNLRRVINATGVVLHTNLGRAKLSEKAVWHMIDVCCGYSNLEYSLETGGRGERYAHVEEMLKALTGAQAALVVNNNAAAVFLALHTLAKDRQVIVSRGELVEIGGSFRVPEIMEASGCKLIEVGTTNKTHPKDFESAIGRETAALLKVHTSNYKIVGFTHEVTLDKMRGISRDHNLPLIYDLGAGLVSPLAGICGEPDIPTCVKQADILCFSGDKLLGGPQAGIILGQADHIGRMKENPLLRMLRIDKMTLAALETTLWQHLDASNAKEQIPTLKMLVEAPAVLRRRAQNLLDELLESAGWILTLVETKAQVGGGALPDVELPTWAVGLETEEMSPDELVKRLRRFAVPIIARIYRDQVLLDMRTVDDTELPLVASCVNMLIQGKK